MLRASQRHHSKAMWKWRQMLLQLVRRPARRNEVKLVEIKPPVAALATAGAPRESVE